MSDKDLEQQEQELSAQDEQDVAEQNSTAENQEAGGEEAGELSLEEQLELAQQKADSNWDAYVRSQAEMENLRRRARLDVESAHKYALEKFVNSLIPVADSLELGLDAANKEDANLEGIKEGVEMTFKQFLDVMAEFNVERINPQDEKFDPKLHEAMTMIPSPDHEPNTVIEVFQKGYSLNERLIRPARVIVAQA